MSENNLILYESFTEINKKKFVNDSFQNFLIENISFDSEINGSRFYRCDFRGTKLNKVVFSKIEFERSDFIDCYIEYTSFNECKFGTDFFNTYFFKTKFYNNQQNTSSLVNCAFYKCEFINEKFCESTIRECKFIECKFKNCTIKQNTIDEIVFDNCTLNQMDFSNSTAQNFSFINCTFSELTINPDYLGTYLFKSTRIDLLKYSHKGKLYSVGEHFLEPITNLLLYYKKVGRFYEFFNLLIIHNQLCVNAKSLVEAIQDIFPKVLSDKHLLRKRNNVMKIFDSLIFYSNSQSISFFELTSLIKYLENINNSKMDFNLRIEIFSKLQILKINIEEICLNWDVNLRFPLNSIGVTRLVFEDNDIEIIKQRIKEYFEVINRKYFKYAGNELFYKIINTSKGSIIIDIISYAGATLLLATILRSITSNVFNTIFDYEIFTKSKKLLNNVSSLNDIKEIDNFRKNSLQVPSVLVKKKTQELSELLKSIKIFVNTFNE